MNKVTKNIAALIAIGLGSTTIGFAQVTQQKIGNNPTLINPNAVLEIESTAKGLLMPRLALTATNNFAPLTAHVTGMTVYNTGTSAVSVPDANKVTPGYYYNDGTQWVRVATGADAKTEPWRQQGTTNEATANGQNIYQTGSVAVGDFSTAASTKKMEVKGDFKAEASAGTAIFGTEINSPLVPPGLQNVANYWVNAAEDYRASVVHANAAAISAGTEGTNPNSGMESIIAVDNDRATIGSRFKNLDSKAEMRMEKTGNFYLEAYDTAPALNYGSTVSLQNDGLRMVHSTTQGAGANWLSTSNRSEIFVQKANGVRFAFRNSGGTQTGEYWFPTTTGTAGQVLTQSGTGGRIEWRSPSTFGTANNGLTKNVTNGDFELGGTLNRATDITLNTRQLSFIGTAQRTNITPSGGLVQEGIADLSYVLVKAGDANNNSVRTNLFMQAYDSGSAQIVATEGATSLNIGTSFTIVPSPIIFSTNEVANTNHVEKMRLTPSGQLAIGATTVPTITAGSATINPKLHVAGDISTTGKVWTTNSVYADYVFEKYFQGNSEINPNYEFKSLNYVKDFIKANHHLPGVESIDELSKAENGYTFDITKLTVQSLEKIEELYLHTIEQQEKIDQQQSEINKLKKEAEETNIRLEKLEELLVKQ